MNELPRAAKEAADLYDIVGTNNPRDNNGNGGSSTGDELQLVAGLFLLSTYSTPEAGGGGR